MDTNDISKIENAIGYKFKNPTILEQAFIRKSYANEHEGLLDNEVLEFYGDRVLDNYVTKLMFKKFSTTASNKQFYSQKNENELTRIKANNVDRENLSYCMRLLGLADYLCLGSSDEENDVRYNDSVGEDLFEAIIGAVTVDCDWDDEIINNVCQTMLSVANFNDDYIWLIENWCDKHGYDCSFRDTDPVNNTYSCTLYVGNKSFIAEGKSSFFARMTAAEKAYNELYETILISEVGDIGEDNPVVQLNKLYQKEYIDKPNYYFDEKHYEDGEPYWICKCKLGVDGFEGTENGDTKKGAKTNAASIVIEHLLKKE